MMPLERPGNMRMAKTGWLRGPKGLGLWEDTAGGVKAILRVIILFLELNIER